ncbi:MAG: DUF962 domain-containing protein [Flavobacteriales bacterium]|nr:DUF962 domain-containing protein [Flavobacteriales bacterium]
MSKIDRLLGEYRESHQNDTNQVIHNIFVPLIFLSAIGILWDVKLPVELSFLGGEPLNVAMIVAVLVFAYYLSISFAVAVGIISVTAVGMVLCYLYHGPISIWIFSLAIFVVSWVFQLVGHKIEGKKPSFFKDLEFFLVGPMWVLVKLYNKLGIKY